MTTKPRDIGRYLALSAGITLVYYLLGRLGLLMVLPPYQVAPIYPAAGWGLAVLLVWGLRYLPAGRAVYAVDPNAYCARPSARHAQLAPSSSMRNRSSRRREPPRAISRSSRSSITDHAIAALVTAATGRRTPSVTRSCT